MSHTQLIVFVERIKSLYVAHEGVQNLWRRFSQMREDRSGKTREEEQRNIFITGPSGIGKSQIGLRYCRQYPAYDKVLEDGTRQKITPVVYCKLPYPFTALEFYQKLTKALGGRIFKPKEYVHVAKSRVLDLLVLQEVELLILDEMDFIQKSNMSDERGMEHFKDLANSGTCLACVGTQNIRHFRTLDEQYQGRFEPYEIPPFSLEEFYGLLGQIEKQLDPPNPVDLGNPEVPYGELLHHWTKGTLRPLYKILVESYRILGVFDDVDVIDMSSLKLDTSILEEAAGKILGE
ncbi:TniB family NTP-binding protein [Alicyclobacillus sp. SO9]|uniref:TniB family NTP-binding protein n=1 Tax=Alicyclobacillus sp. SO9 TaxID=2665646 RepID=UPI0018E8CEF0|nr:TniB family NTP-binding protein [Alicyclobacillus sp. SO9]QQE78367.1 TniB family NTP-binding protein [Alicyclobacillus sp. SO9]